jgi:ubiquinone/menaquinone biosynthesis C-methylase UbiE
VAAPPPDPARAFWDRQARRYDASMAILGRPLPAAIALAVEEVRGLAEVLEVGAGTGLFTVPVARAVGRVHATDFSAPMVDLLAARLRREGVANARAEVRDLYALGVPPASFDAVLCANVLHLVPDLPRALGALRAALRPGGKLVAPTYAHAQTALSRAVSRLGALVGFPARRRVTAASLAGELAANGFRVHRTEVVPGLVPIAFVAATRSNGGSARLHGA